METESFMLSLSCQLTTEERGVRGSELAQKMEEREQVVLAFDEAKTNFKGRTQGIDAEIMSLKQTVLEGRELREIECFKKFEFESDVVHTVRTDTGEIAFTRRMTPEERQQFLPLVDETLRSLDDDTKPGN